MVSVRKKTAVLLTLGILVFLVVTQSCFIKYVDADPFGTYEDEYYEISPLAYPTITILSPTENNTLLNQNNLVIAFRAVLEPGSASTPTGIVDFYANIDGRYYESSWESNITNVTSWDFSDPWNPIYFINLTGIPEGNQTVTITAYGKGGYIETVQVVHPEYFFSHFYIEEYNRYYDFDVASNYIIGFIVDTIPPLFSVLKLDNKSFFTPEVTLSYALNEHASRITYSLDGQENVTIAGNTTLTVMSIGEHSITVYATDEAGNTSASETLFFTVEEPFPILLVASIVIIVIVVFAFFLLVRKYKH